jgi:hypothetical protein
MGLYVKVQGAWLVTKAALIKQRCDCCYTRKKIIMPIGTTGDFVIPKVDWGVNAENKWPTPVFINASTKNTIAIAWGYNNIELPTQLIIHVGAGTTTVDYHIII